MHVFTYGTLMFPEIWRCVVGRQFATVPGTVPGFEIYRVEGAVFPGIIAADERRVVHGVIYLDVDHPSLARLDLFEDDFYERQALWVDCSDGKRRPAEAYVVPACNRHVLSNEPWNRASFVAGGGLERFTRGFAGFQRIERGDP